jgi:uncharacterized protein
LNPIKQYRIGFVGLSIGKHRFSFEIGPDFFLHFGEAAFEAGKVMLELELLKSNNMLELDFHFSGDVQLTCDRCLAEFPYRMELQTRLLVKFGDQYSEQTDEILIIPSTESHIDVSQFVYEFLHLGMPVKRVHPEGDDGESGCDPEVMRKLQEYQNKPGGTDDDSPWRVLKSLNFNS